MASAGCNTALAMRWTLLMFVLLLVVLNTISAFGAPIVLVVVALIASVIVLIRYRLMVDARYKARWDRARQKVRDRRSDRK